MTTNLSDDYATGDPGYDFDQLSDELYNASKVWEEEIDYDILIDFARHGGKPAFYGDSYELEVFLSGKSIGSFDSLEDAESMLGSVRDLLAGDDD